MSDEHCNGLLEVWWKCPECGAINYKRINKCVRCNYELLESTQAKIEVIEMSGDDGVLITKLGENNFTLRWWIGESGTKEKKTFSNLEAALNYANDLHSEYGISYIDKSIVNMECRKCSKKWLDSKYPSGENILYSTLCDHCIEEVNRIKKLQLE
ncbi:MAG: zinc finger Ran-binding domain-containing protein [Gammaproteobacteria bacterium]|nr:zinc finger Ran-binding domain-containing protein [Gammaproteobacteria bacterium]